MEKKIDVTKFDLLDKSGEVLKGGFSAAYSGGGFCSKENLLTIDETNECSTTNENCAGANCIASCGK